MKKFLPLIILSLIILPLITACGNSAEKTAEQPAEKTAAAVKAPANKILVAYFSCTGNTKKAALEVAEMLNADTFEIVPAKAYTSDDLDYNVENCRANLEQKDGNSRPEIKTKLENPAQYKTIVLAFPIWWGVEPRIIDTFVESYDLAGKTIIPVCTSGGSDIMTAEKNLQGLCKGATVENGKRLDILSKDEVKAWLDSLKL